MADILARGAPRGRPEIARFWTLRFGERKTKELRAGDSATRLARRGPGANRTPDGSVAVSQRALIGKLPPLDFPPYLWAQLEKTMDPLKLEQFRSLLGQLSWNVAGSRPDIPAPLGELSERWARTRSSSPVPIMWPGYSSVSRRTEPRGN